MTRAKVIATKLNEGIKGDSYKKGDIVELEDKRAKTLEDLGLVTTDFTEPTEHRAITKPSGRKSGKTGR